MTLLLSKLKEKRTRKKFPQRAISTLRLDTILQLTLTGYITEQALLLKVHLWVWKILRKVTLAHTSQRQNVGLHISWICCPHNKAPNSHCLLLHQDTKQDFSLISQTLQNTIFRRLTWKCKAKMYKNQDRLKWMPLFKDPSSDKGSRD